MFVIIISQIALVIAAVSSVILYRILISSSLLSYPESLIQTRASLISKIFAAGINLIIILILDKVSQHFRRILSWLYCVLSLHNFYKMHVYLSLFNIIVLFTHVTTSFGEKQFEQLNKKSLTILCWFYYIVWYLVKLIRIFSYFCINKILENKLNYLKYSGDYVQELRLTFIGSFWVSMLFLKIIMHLYLDFAYHHHTIWCFNNNKQHYSQYYNNFINIISSHEFNEQVNEEFAVNF